MINEMDTVQYRQPTLIDCTELLSSYSSSTPHHQVTALGNPNILRTRKLALLCSVKCPGQIILRTLNLARVLRESDETVISGFHSPMEQEVLTSLLRGNGNVIICPARSLEGMRLPAAWMKALKDNRLLLLSPFAAHQRRQTVRQAHSRNEFVAGLADRVLIAYAAPGGKIESLAHRLSARNMPLFMLDTTDNTNLLQSGALPFRL